LYPVLFRERVEGITIDELPIQLIKEVRTPLPAGPNHREKYDYEYQRNGTANVFLFTEPLNGWRKVTWHGNDPNTVLWGDLGGNREWERGGAAKGQYLDE